VTTTDTPAIDPNAPTHRRRNITLAIVLVLVAGWAFAIIWSVTVTSHSPERLQRSEAATISSMCTAARTKLQALPKSFPRTGADRVARIRAENGVLTEMTTSLGTVHPEHASPAKALKGWAADWTSVIGAREHYASDLETKQRARLVLPANSGGLKPVTDRMDDFVRENHPDLDACFTESLALDTGEGPREYKPQTK
jgi:hypothetical protein